MTNYNWKQNSLLELGIGLSCCPSPEEVLLDSIWDRHRTSLLNLIYTLQGIHIRIDNVNPRSAASVWISETGETFDVQEYGELWRLLGAGKYTVTVSVAGFKNMTKVVTVSHSRFTDVVFVMPFREPAVPRFIVFSFSATIFTIFLLFLLYCQCHKNQKSTAKKRKQQKQRQSSSSYNGFQLLKRDVGESNFYRDDVDEEDEIEFLNVGTEKYGLPPKVKVYHDLATSSSEDEDKNLLEDGIKAKKSQQRRQNL